jgi:hypothetical protein
MTGGTYYPATSASQLQNVFNNLPTYLISKHEVLEVSVAFAAAGALLAALALFRQSPRPLAALLFREVSLFAHPFAGPGSDDAVAQFIASCERLARSMGCARITLG